MYYEFYIDQFFVEHLLIGYLLIRLAVKIGRADISWKRILAGSLANTAVMTLAVCAGASWWHYSGLPLTSIIVFQGGKWKGLRNGILSLIFTTVCFGGALEALLQLWGLPLAVGGAAASVLLEGAGTYREKQRVRLEKFVEVQLTCQGKTASICGMIDTGNQLTEPFTGHPVSIVEEDTVKSLLGDGWEEKRGFYLIPYHSIGKDKGWMKGVSIDRIVVGTGTRRAATTRPILAICRGAVSAGRQYQMILHPQHAAPGKIEGGE